MQRLNVTPGKIAVQVKALPDADARTDEHVNTFALQWFAQMRTGQIDRSHLSAEYNAHLSDEAVAVMSEYLGRYEFGAEPVGAHIMRRRTSGDQAFYLTKILFPRGDAASLLFGFDTSGKITGVSLMSMAGD
jgi:hypothetical protein